MSYTIESLGESKIDSPLKQQFRGVPMPFVSDNARVLVNPVIDGSHTVLDVSEVQSFEMAGPREKIFFHPSEVRCAIVTCGGLCPGINDVIRSIVMTSYYHYGISSILGIRYGYQGLRYESPYEPMELTPELVEDIHLDGGTILGSSRGGTENIDVIVDGIEKLGVNILYTIGGDGTQRGAHRISKTAHKRGLKLAVVGIPKTIDNDISFIQKSFGFETAFSEAVKAIASAHVEAKGAPNGIGLVKLMGRHSGFIAANATLAMNDVNFVLVPEVPFDLEGPNGFLAHLEQRILKRHHAVVCVAEGAGQDLLVGDKELERDASGNVKLEDIGIYLRDKIIAYFDARKIPINLKYIDPSYMIRSAPANPNDSVFCNLLGQNAVHAAMAGKTNLLIGLWNNIFTHVPIELAISKRKQIDPNSTFWSSVLQATGQSPNMKN
ncbi:MAG: ATP-dependent 6-phosphofructokinase [Spirochaetes bacterium]|nr:ATP-dependent 6-phosphofructokinase [Spirochaetota bacterium]